MKRIVGVHVPIFIVHSEFLILSIVQHVARVILIFNAYVYTFIYIGEIYGRESAHVVDKFPSGRSYRIYSRFYSLA